MSLPTSTHPFLITGNDGNRHKITNSLRFRASNSAYLVRTPINASNRSTWTWSAWIKRGSLGSQRSLFTSYYASSAYDRFEFTSSDTLRYQHVSSSITYIDVATTAVFRDPSAWYHVVLRMDGSQSSGSRWKLYVNGVQQTFTGTDNTNASLINNNNITYIGYDQQSGTYFDGYMAEVNFVDGYAYDPSYFGYTDTLTNQWIPKRYTGTYGINGFYLPFKDNTTATSENKATYSEAFDDASWAKPAAPVAPTVTANAIAAPNGTTTADRIEFSGPTAHPVYKEYSFTIANGSTVTTSVYLKNYIAGSYNLQCFIFTPTNLDSYTNIVFDSNGVLTSCTPVGGDAANTTAEFYDVGNGWYRVVCRHTNNSGSSEGGCRISVGQNGNSGASGVYAWGAQMELSSTVGPYFATAGSAGVSTYRIGRDASNGDASWNNWAGYGIGLFSPANTVTTAHDSYIDSPTTYDDGSVYYNRGNYPVLNPFSNPTNTIYTVSNGNLTYYCPSSSGNGGRMSVASTFALGAGKYYWEAYPTDTNGGFGLVGYYNQAVDPVATANPGNTVYIVGFSSNQGAYNITLTYTGTTFTYTANDLIGLAYDGTAGTLAFYKNGSLIGTYSGISTSYLLYPGTVAAASAAATNYSINFGQRPFRYTPPDGFKALNTYNLPNPLLPLV
jgi:hypothetical protein